MEKPAEIAFDAESLLDLLIGQCEDLEALLSLARSEQQAAGSREFDELLRVTKDRATLGERLEVYHRQITELREKLGSAAEPVMESPVAQRISELVSGIQAEDRTTMALLTGVREEIVGAQEQFESRQKGLNAYLQEGRMPAVACDQLA